MTMTTKTFALAIGALLTMPVAGFAQDQHPSGGDGGTRTESQRPGGTTQTTTPGMQPGTDKGTNPTTGSEPRSPGAGTEPGGTGGTAGGGTTR